MLHITILTVVLRVQASGVPARLALAAMNASMVGILCRPRRDVEGQGGGVNNINETHNSQASSNRTRASGICQVNLTIPTPASLHTTNDHHNNSTSIPTSTPRYCSIFFDEQHSGSSSSSTEDGNVHGLWPCLGVGIVRCIDLDRSLLYLITPVAAEVLQAANAENTGKTKNK